MSNRKPPATTPSGSLPRRVQCLLNPDSPAVIGEWKCEMVIDEDADIGDEGNLALFRRSDEHGEIGTIYLRYPDADLLVHECVHAASWMVKRGGIELDEETYAEDDHEEKVAHATGYLASKLLPALNDQDTASLSHEQGRKIAMQTPPTSTPSELGAAPGSVVTYGDFAKCVANVPHNWGKWSITAKLICKNWGTVSLIQARQCSICGLTESKRQTI